MAALGGAALIISPDGVRSGIKKHMKLICSLCLLCVMISPVSELIEGIKNIGNGNANVGGDESGLHSMYESIYEGNIEEGFGDGIGEKVKERLLSEFSIPKDQCRVEISFADNDGDGFREPYRITVILSGGAVFKDPRSIEARISEIFACKCVCAVE